MAARATKEEIIQQVKQEYDANMMQEVYNQITAKCFQKCIGKPGDKLDKEEQKCLAKCVDRYIDSREVVTSTMVDVGGRPGK
mmetsp:Transcript_23550/g.19776  ORF Transcript_23550/g.19776 Transcript_23550/m.19776 type:complete len:82 (+) Transcript_23550:1-246(+)